LMKDAYSFHADENSLRDTYKVMHATYTRIFQRVGLKFRPVAADSGSIGGSASHEFHALANSGEDSIAICDHCDYAANIELAPTLVSPAKRAGNTQSMQTVNTPNAKSIEEVSQLLKVPAKQTVKTLLVKGVNGVVALVVRGDHVLNVIKVEKLSQVAKPMAFVTPAEAHVVSWPPALNPGPLDPWV